MNALSQPEIDYIEATGLSMQAEGLPKIAGRLFALLLLLDKPVSFADLSEQLDVSRGSISTNSRLLESLGLIERVSLPGDRQDYFRVPEDPYTELLSGYAERMQSNLDRVEKTLSKLPSSRDAARSRLEHLQDFYRQTIANTRHLIRQWSQADD